MTQPFSDTESSSLATKAKTSPRLMSGQQTVLSVLMAIVPLLCLGTLGYVFHDTAYREKTHALLAQKAMSSGQSIDSFLEEKISNLRQEAASASIKELSDPGYLRTRLHSLQNAYQGVFLNLDLIDSSGRVIAHTDGAETGPEPGRESYSMSAILPNAKRNVSWECASPSNKPPGCCERTLIQNRSKTRSVSFIPEELEAHSFWIGKAPSAQMGKKGPATGKPPCCWRSNFFPKADPSYWRAKTQRERPTTTDAPR